MDKEPTTPASPTPTQQPTQSQSSQSRGRGRGRRGGRGRGRPTPVSTSAPLSFQERAAEVAASQSAPVQPLPAQPVPLSQLSAMMDAYFPVAQEPQDYVSDVVIDPSGYVKLVRSTYAGIRGLHPTIDKELSEAEFLLACGYLLVYRSFECYSKFHVAVYDGWLTLKESMRSLPPIPEPIAMYLTGMGLYRDPYGHTLSPILVLPRLNRYGSDLDGMLPTLQTTDYDTIDYRVFSSMFPFGLIERTIVQQATAAAAGQLFTRFNPGAPDNANDPVLARTATYPDYRCAPPHADRRPRMLQARNDEETDLLLCAIRWSPQIMQDFCNFCVRIQKWISCVPYPPTTAGSPAMTAYVERTNGTATRNTGQYDVGSYISLTSSEMHAARLFKYRRFRSNNRDLYADDQDDGNRAITTAPSGMNARAPLSITTITSDTMMLNHFVRLYLKPQ